MKICNGNHRVSFVERDIGAISNSGHINAWRIDAICPACQVEVKEVQIKSALENMYSPEIAGLIFNAYEHKKAYLEAISKLSSNGIQCSLSPEN